MDWQNYPVVAAAGGDELGGLVLGRWSGVPPPPAATGACALVGDGGFGDRGVVVSGVDPGDGDAAGGDADQRELPDLGDRVLGDERGWIHLGLGFWDQITHYEREWIRKRTDLRQGRPAVSDWQREAWTERERDREERGYGLSFCHYYFGNLRIKPWKVPVFLLDLKFITQT